MSPEFHTKWAHILQDVEKTTIPISFVKKVLMKLVGRKQRTINIERYIKQGYSEEEIEDILTVELLALEPDIVSFEFVLDVDRIAELVQPETDRLLNQLQ